MKTRWIAVAVAVGLSICSVAAEDKFWNLFDGDDPISGSFGDENNWLPSGAPGNGDWIFLVNDAGETPSLLSKIIAVEGVG